VFPCVLIKVKLELQLAYGSCHVTATDAFKAASRRNSIPRLTTNVLNISSALLSLSTHSLTHPASIQVMSAVPSILTASPASTPSKKVGSHFTAHSGALLTGEPRQAAAAMKVMSLETPSKSVRKSPALLFEEEEAEEVPEVGEVEDLRTRFVGDVETTEGTPVPLIVLGESPDRGS